MTSRVYQATNFPLDRLIRLVFTGDSVLRENKAVQQAQGTRAHGLQGPTEAIKLIYLFNYLIQTPILGSSAKLYIYGAREFLQ